MKLKAVVGAALVAWGCGGAASPGSGPTGSAGQPGPSELDQPATLSVVSVPAVDPGWPINDLSWLDSSLNPKVTLTCDGVAATGQFDYTLEVAAGAGLDYRVTTRSSSPVVFCNWAGPPSQDGRSIVGAPTSCSYTSSAGNAVTMTLETIAMRLVEQDLLGGRTARVFATAKLEADGSSCSFALDDFEVRTTAISSASLVTGRHDEVLPSPVALTGWGEFAVTGAGQAVTDAATFRRALTVEADESLPAGLVLDPMGYALKTPGDNPRVDVVVGMTNEGDRPLCFSDGEILSVTNDAGIPVVSDVIRSSLIAPVLSSSTCLRPTEKGWFWADLGFLTSAAPVFTSGTRVRISPPSVTPFTGGAHKFASTPFRLRQSPVVGLEVDFVGAPVEAFALFFDEGGLPLGVANSSQVFPKKSERPQVSSVAFPQRPVLGSTAKVVVFPD